MKTLKQIKSELKALHKIINDTHHKYDLLQEVAYKRVGDILIIIAKTVGVTLTHTNYESFDLEAEDKFIKLYSSIKTSHKTLDKERIYYKITDAFPIEWYSYSDSKIEEEVKKLYDKYLEEAQASIEKDRSKIEKVLLKAKKLGLSASDISVLKEGYCL